MPSAAIFLCDLTGNMAEPWAEAGVECYCVDVEHSIRRERVEGNIHFVWGDARSWTPPAGVDILFVAAFPPCTHVAVSGARDYATKRGVMLRDALETFEACRLAATWSGAPYMIENPVGVLSSVPHIGKPNHYFDPWHFTKLEPADNYTKKPVSGRAMVSSCLTPRSTKRLDRRMIGSSRRRQATAAPTSGVPPRRASPARCLRRTGRTETRPSGRFSTSWWDDPTKPDCRYKRRYPAGSPDSHLIDSTIK